MLFAPEYQKKRIHIIEQALKKKLPRTYSVLKASGNLKQFLESHEESMMHSFSKAYCDASIRILQKNMDSEKTVQFLRTASNEVWRNTLATWLEFNYPTAETNVVRRISDC